MAPPWASRRPFALRRICFSALICLTALSVALSVRLWFRFIANNGGVDFRGDGGGDVAAAAAEHSAFRRLPPPPARRDGRSGVKTVRTERGIGSRSHNATANNDDSGGDGGLYVLVYRSADCTGSPLRIDYRTAGEKRCDHCSDLCRVSFPGESQRANMGQGPRSVIIHGGDSHRADLYESCVGTWIYPDNELVSVVRPGMGCTTVHGALGHVKFVPASEPPRHWNGSLPVIKSDDPVKDSSYVLLYQSEYCTGATVRISYSSSEAQCDHCRNLCGFRFDEYAFQPVSDAGGKSLQVFGEHQLDVYRDCLSGTASGGGSGGGSDHAQQYAGTVRAEDGCVNLAQATKRVGHVRFVRRGAHSSPSEESDGEPRLYNVVFSVESSHYMAWQSRALQHSYRQTQPSLASRLTRLLTAIEPDDLMDEFRTVQVPRHPYSKMYSPYNKPDSLTKWLHSAYGPAEDVIVVIDPDNFLLKDLTLWVERVERGKPIAQSAWYHNDPRVDELWSVVCDRNCDRNKTDHAAVPLFIHREDLREIAPLWSYYTMKVKWYERMGKLEKFQGHQIVEWSVEMIGYVFASAHVGVEHRIERYLQLRDVDPTPKPEVFESLPMLHAGRAWFPESYDEGARWQHTEGLEISRRMGRGRQVWCKCNVTAWEVIPWPLPPEGGVDFVSNHTLRILHEAKALNPTFPDSKYRRYGEKGRHNFDKYD